MIVVTVGTCPLRSYGGRRNGVPGSVLGSILMRSEWNKFTGNGTTLPSSRRPLSPEELPLVPGRRWVELERVLSLPEVSELITGKT